MIARVCTRTANIVVALWSDIRKAETLSMRASAYQRIEDRIHDQMQRNRDISSMNGAICNDLLDIDSVGRTRRVRTKQLMGTPDLQLQFFGSGLTTRVAEGVSGKLVLVWQFLSTSELLGLKKERPPAPAGSGSRSKRTN